MGDNTDWRQSMKPGDAADTRTATKEELKKLTSDGRWNRYFIDMANLVACKSKDRSTRVGALIIGPDKEVRSTGYNGFCRGVNDNIEKRHHRPAKYLWTEHAERNAIFNAARAQIGTKGCVMYLNWEPMPCADCARAIIQAGIIEVIGPKRPFEGKGELWEQSCKVGRDMMLEAGLIITTDGYCPRESVISYAT